jgi:Abnormal spindle-like microcephaly-assoc'd, ASPM-SPD-2-Hydin
MFLLAAFTPARTKASANSCVLSAGSWMNVPVQQQTGTFRVTYTASASAVNVDGVTGLSSGPANEFSDLAAAIRFNSSGTIDAMNGSAYTAASTIRYSSGVPYQFTLFVNFSSHTYNAYVIIGTGIKTIGTNLAFRTTQSHVALLNNVGAMTAPGTTNVCNITLSRSTTPLAITTQPTSRSVAAGQIASFSIASTGTAPLIYQWMKNGAAISGANSSNYSTPLTTIADNGTRYTASVSNSTRTVTSNIATLTVTSKVAAPSISAQPVGRTVTTGQTSSFSVTASGTATLTYQWMKNGAAISGANAASYITPATKTTDSGSRFAVIVTNGSGSVSSSSASLTVTAAGTLLLNSSSSALSFGKVNVSSSGTQNVTLTNAGNSNVTISQVLVAGAGFNSSNASGIILSPGQTTTLTSTFVPSANGAATGKITVSSNATNSPASISLSGTGATADTHSVQLSWSNGVSGVTGFNTYSSTVSGGPYVKMGSTASSDPSYTDTSVQTGRTYYYVVTAINSSNQESGYSSEVTAIVP